MKFFIRHPFNRFGPPLVFGLPRLASTFFNTGLFVLTLPVIVNQAVGPADKGLHLGLISGAAALISIAAVYCGGLFVDREHYGSRARLIVVFSLCITLPAIFIIAAGCNYTLMVAAMIIGFVCRSLTDTGLLSMLAGDIRLRPRERFTLGLVFQHFMGAILGVMIFSLLPLTSVLSGRFDFYPVAGVAFCITTVALSCILELGRQKNKSVQKKECKSGKSFVRNRMVLTSGIKQFLAARVCFFSGILIVPTFLVFMVQDLMMPLNIHHAAGVLLGCSLAGGLLSSWISAWGVSRFGEIQVLLKAGWLLAAAAPLFLLAAMKSMTMAMICMGVFGIGFGAVMVAGTSLSVKLSGNTDIRGRFMALVTISTFLSQFLASFLGGLILDNLNSLGHHYGYWGLVILVECFFALGGYWLKKI